MFLPKHNVHILQIYIKLCFYSKTKNNKITLLSQLCIYSNDKFYNFFDLCFYTGLQIYKKMEMNQQNKEIKRKAEDNN